jgi:hypothetical protein
VVATTFQSDPTGVRGCWAAIIAHFSSLCFLFSSTSNFCNSKSFQLPLSIINPQQHQALSFYPTRTARYEIVGPHPTTTKPKAAMASPIQAVPIHRLLTLILLATMAAAKEDGNAEVAFNLFSDVAPFVALPLHYSGLPER